MRGELDREGARRVVVHLLGDCPSCRRVTAPASPFAARIASPEDQPGDARRLIRELEHGERRRQKEEQVALGLVAEIADLPQARRLLLVRNSRRFQSPSVVETLLADSWASRFDDPQRTLDLADVAVAVSEALRPADLPAAIVSDLRGRAWAARGNALRIKSDLRGAEASFARAREYLDEGTGDPLEEARLCSFIATALSADGRYEEAVAVQERLVRLHTRMGDDSQVGTLLVSLANYHFRSGDRRRAIAVAMRAVGMLDAESDPRLALAVRHNLVMYLHEDGRFEEALAVLAKLKPEYAKLGDRINLLRLIWVEGLIAHKLRDVAAAEQAYHTAGHGFVEQEMALDAARVALDLGSLLLEQRRTEGVRELATAVETVFRSLDIPSEALAAWALFVRAVEIDQLTAALVAEVAESLERSVGRTSR